MLKILKKFILSIFFLLIKLKRKILPPKNGLIFLAPDIPINNLGDQALLMGTTRGLLEHQYSPIYLVATGPQAIKDIYGAKKLNSTVIIIQNLFTLFATDRAFKETLKFYWLTTKAKSLLLVGADVLDGRYNAVEAARKLNIVLRCSNLGLNARIVGFSLSKDISPLSKSAFEKLAGKVDFYARDAISQQRAVDYVPCKLSADCAFMLPPEKVEKIRQPKLIEWINSQKTVFAICLRIQDFEMENSEEVLTSFTNGLVNASKKHGSSILLLPHHSIDIKILTRVKSKLDELEVNHFLVKELPSAAEIKGIVGLCHHILTSRMHTSIASLGMGKAVTCLPYADKFEGLYQHFELTNASLNREKLDDETYVENYLFSRLTDTESISQLVNKNLEKVKALSVSNIKDLN